MILKKILLGLTLTLTLLLSGALSTMAEETAAETVRSIPTIPKPALLPGPKENATQAEVQNYLSNQAIPDFINGFMASIAGLALIVLVWSGIRFISAGGEEEGITNAKKTATYAVVGLVVAILSYAIISIINTLSLPSEADGYNEDTQENVIYKDI